MNGAPPQKTKERENPKTAAWRLFDMGFLNQKLRILTTDVETIFSYAEKSRWVQVNESAIYGMPGYQKFLADQLHVFPCANNVRSF
jgi:hypothetical protein